LIYRSRNIFVFIYLNTFSHKKWFIVSFSQEVKAWTMIIQSCFLNWETTDILIFNNVVEQFETYHHRPRHLVEKINITSNSKILDDVDEQHYEISKQNYFILYKRKFFSFISLVKMKMMILMIMKNAKMTTTTRMMMNKNKLFNIRLIKNETKFMK
jgi:hypothetical protein